MIILKNVSPKIGNFFDENKNEIIKLTQRRDFLFIINPKLSIILFEPLFSFISSIL